MNAYAATALIIGWLTVAHTRATATVGGTHLSIPLIWLLALAIVLALAFAVLILWRAIMRDGGLWLTPRPASA